jgi:hypothetical protein
MVRTTGAALAARHSPSRSMDVWALGRGDVSSPVSPDVNEVFFMVTAWPTIVGMLARRAGSIFARSGAPVVSCPITLFFCCEFRIDLFCRTTIMVRKGIPRNEGDSRGSRCSRLQVLFKCLDNKEVPL